MWATLCTTCVFSALRRSREVLLLFIFQKAHNNSFLISSWYPLHVSHGTLRVCLSFDISRIRTFHFFFASLCCFIPISQFSRRLCLLCGVHGKSQQTQTERGACATHNKPFVTGVPPCSSVFCGGSPRFLLLRKRPIPLWNSGYCQ